MKFKLTPYNLQELGQRQNQEDSLFPGVGQQTASDRLFILCDGMGGHEKGEVASATVCEVMSQTILSNWNPDEPLSDGLLQQAIEDAYDALDTKDNGEERKMGTTMTLVCFHADGVTVAHIGDSRVYQLRPNHPSLGGNGGGSIVFKTRDHSLVNDLIEIGEITEEEARNYPQKNVITRAMQPCQERRAKASIAHLTDIQNGDYFYMCSDGMLEQSTDDNILNIITKKNATNDQKIEMLRNVTEENKDNHTAHLIHIDKVEGKAPVAVAPKPSTPQGVLVTPQQEKPKKNYILFIILAVIISALAIATTFFMKSPGSKDSVEETMEKVDSLEKVEKKEIHHKTMSASVKETNNDTAKNKTNKPVTSQKPSQNEPAPETSVSTEEPIKEQAHKPSAKDAAKIIEQLNKDQNKK